MSQQRPASILGIFLLVHHTQPKVSSHRSRRWPWHPSPSHSAESPTRPQQGGRDAEEGSDVPCDGAGPVRLLTRPTNHWSNKTSVTSSPRSHKPPRKKTASCGPSILSTPAKGHSVSLTFDSARGSAARQVAGSPSGSGPDIISAFRVRFPSTFSAAEVSITGMLPMKSMHGEKPSQVDTGSLLNAISSPNLCRAPSWIKTFFAQSLQIGGTDAGMHWRSETVRGPAHHSPTRDQYTKSLPLILIPLGPSSPVHRTSSVHRSLSGVRTYHTPSASFHIRSRSCHTVSSE